MQINALISKSDYLTKPDTFFCSSVVKHLGDAAVVEYLARGLDLLRRFAIFLGIIVLLSAPQTL